MESHGSGRRRGRPGPGGPRDEHAQPRAGGTLQTIVDLARDAVPGVDHAGISVVRDGRLETRAATDEVVHLLDDLQYALDDGP